MKKVLNKKGMLNKIVYTNEFRNETKPTKHLIYYQYTQSHDFYVKFLLNNFYFIKGYVQIYLQILKC